MKWSVWQLSSQSVCQVQSILATGRFSLRNFLSRELCWGSAHALRTSSFERELTHPKSSEQNLSHVNENTTKSATSPSQWNQVKHVSEFAWRSALCTSSERLFCICINAIRVRCFCVSFRAIKRFVSNFCLFRSFENVTPSYNIALMGNSDSL
jgi:hypothetical protein